MPFQGSSVSMIFSRVVLPAPRCRSVTAELSPVWWDPGCINEVKVSTKRLNECLAKIWRTDSPATSSSVLLFNQPVRPLLHLLSHPRPRLLQTLGEVLSELLNSARELLISNNMPGSACPG